MSDERLESRIASGMRPFGEVTVEIQADEQREEDFEAVREAVKEVLND